jgi:surfactin synthase thioesterase subunit
VNWGLWDTGGMVDDVTRAQLEQRGLRALSAATACAALDRLVRARLPQAAVVDMDRARTSLSSSPPAPSAHTTAATQAFEQALAHAPLDAQPALWVEFLAAHAARILRMPRAELDVTRALTDLGLDSLMASELRRATHVAGTTLPLARLLKGASLLELAHDLCAQHTGTTSSPQVHVTSSPRTLTSSPWLVVPLPRPQASVQLVCFPYAGGGPPVFHPWAAALPAHIELHTVQLPARAARLDEAPLLRMEQLLPPLVDALAATIDRPFAFVGHCLGSLVMWEVAHALHARLGVLPAQFLVTGGRAPQCYSEAQVALDVQQFSPRPPHEAHTLPDALLLESLRDLGFATSEALFDDDDMRALMLPAVRADFALSNRYTCPARAPLDMPITAIGGRSDPYVTAAQLAGWAAHSTRPLQLEFRPGDHYFIATDRTHLVQRVTSLLAPWAARAERVEG